MVGMTGTLGVAVAYGLVEVALRARSVLIIIDLTTRERQVLDLLAEGASNQQVARSLVPQHLTRLPLSVAEQRLRGRSRIGGVGTKDS